MSTPSIHQGNGAHRAALWHLPTRDLLADVEIWQWLALDVAARLDHESRAYAEYQLAAITDELERRKRLWTARSGDPLRPAWPKPTDAIERRKSTVKRRWSMVRFCRELLSCDLRPSGRDAWEARCPLPGHEDRTPSFHVTESKNLAYCFGCQRGGDVIALTRIYFGESFADALDRLERAV